MAGYIWYSFGSDKTGPELGNALGFSSGKKTPDFDKFSIVVGWGCKPGTAYKAENLSPKIAQRQIKVLNHPDFVDMNRDKLLLLERLSACDVPVPAFVDKRGLTSTNGFVQRVLKAVREGQLCYPIMGIGRYGKGGPVFCQTNEDVKATIREKMDELDFFRSFPNGTEYRVHVFRDSVLFAQIKALSKDPVDACTKHVQKKLEKRKRRSKGVDTVAMPGARGIKLVVEELVGDLLKAPSHVLRNLGKGWDLEKVSDKDVPLEVLEIATGAMEAAGLDMGAVTINSGEQIQVTNITTAPGLDKEGTEIYVEAISEFCKGNKRPETQDRGASKKKSSKNTAPVELVATVRKKMAAGVSKEKAERILKLLED